MRRIGDVIRESKALERMVVQGDAARAARLAEHGFPATVACSWCGDSGRDAGSTSPCVCDAGYAIRAADERRATWERRMPRRVRGFRLSSAPDQDAARAVAGWLAAKPWETGGTLAILGPTGTGKTALGVAALREAHEAGVAVAMVNVGEWVDLMRPSDDPEARLEQDAMERRAKRTALLLLDDLGAERATEYVVGRIYAVCNGRYDADKPTIVTSNYDHAGLLERYDARIVDRLWERSVAVVVAGPNLRRVG